MTASAVTGGSAAEVFSSLGFVPYRAEHLAINDIFEYVGTSYLFDLVKNNETTPEYKINVSQHKDPEIDELIVTAERVI